MRPDLYWIPGPWRGKLAIVTRPRGGDWLDDEAAGWRRAGVDAVVSLLESEESAQLDLLDERRAAEDHGVQFISFPIPDRGVPASTPDAVSLMTRIVAALEEGKKVAVHCRQGIGRSGLIAAGVLITSGLKPDEAIRVVSASRRATVPETAGQLRWTRELRSGTPVASR